MTESIDNLTTATAPEDQPTPGQLIDGLVADIAVGRRAVTRAERDLADATAGVRNRATALVDLVGNRQAAAALLGINPRELASLLPRGSAK